MVEGEGCDEEEDDEASVLTAVVQEHLMCPISFVLLTDPVMAADGNTYQRAAIEEWFMRCQTSKWTTLPQPKPTDRHLACICRPRHAKPPSLPTTSLC